MADDDGMDLTDQEAEALALRLIARHIAEPDWLEWGDVPELGEHAFHRLLAAVDDVAGQLSSLSKARDRSLDIDSADLHSRCT